MNIARIAIRRHMMRVSRVNLFVRVPESGVPKVMEEYLLFDEKLNV